MKCILGMLLGIRNCLKLVLSYKFLILDTYLSDILYLHEQGRKDLRLYFEANRGPRTKRFGERLVVSYNARHSIWF
jgi:hypothetical protein